jgi:thiamine-phosphate pyrophosphorylase
MPDVGPLIVVITDRRRLCAATAVPLRDAADVLRDQVSGALSGGADIVQVRESDLEAKDLARLVSMLVASHPDGPRKIVVNDRTDVAMAAGAAGVHLPERAYSASDARRLLPAAALVGVSVHSNTPARRLADASYAIAGTLKATPSKAETTEYLTWAALADRARDAPCRVAGIGGLTVDDVPRLANARCGFAAIGWFIADGRGDLAGSVKKRVEDVRFRFDSLGVTT